MQDSNNMHERKTHFSIAVMQICCVVSFEEECRISGFSAMDMATVTYFVVVIGIQYPKS